jgi:F420-dependent oxidoreductase-like protein
MKFGLQLSTYSARGGGTSWDSVLAVARSSEAAGLDSVWFADHFMWRDEDDPDRERPNLECFLTLGALASATERVRLGALVVGVPYRNPALLAKMHTTLDVISHGRSIVGLGAGWHKLEFDSYGWPFGTVTERMEKLEDAVQITKLMMTERPATYEGKHYSIHEALNDPLPVQKPHPPIMIGGGGEKKTLRLVAQYADMCNVFGDPEQVAHKFAVLRGHCESVGRPYDEVTKSNHLGLLIARNEAELARKRERFPDFGGFAGTPEQVVERLRAYAAVGSTYVTFTMPDVDDIEPMQLFGETVVPALAEV